MSPKTPIALLALLSACSDGSGGSGTASSSAPAAAESAAPKGPPPYDAKLVVTGKYKVGEVASATVEIDAKDGYHVNPDYPIKFTLGAAEPGIDYPTPVVRDVKRTEARATISVPFKPTAPGQKKLTGECALSVCTPDKCVIAKVPLEATLVVE